MGTQKNRLKETVLWSTQNTCFNRWIRKYLHFYAQKRNWLSWPMIPRCMLCSFFSWVFIELLLRQNAWKTALCIGGKTLSLTHCMVGNFSCRLQSFFQNYSKTCLKRPLWKRPKIGFQDQLSLNAGQKYCRMLQWGAFCNTLDLH